MIRKSQFHTFEFHQLYKYEVFREGYETFSYVNSSVRFVTFRNVLKLTENEGCARVVYCVENTDRKTLR